MRWVADVKILGPVGAMGQRILQPVVKQQVDQVLGALDKQVHRRRDRSAPHGAPVPHRADAAHHGAARARCSRPRAPSTEAGLDTIWLAEAYPWWRKHGMEAKSSTVLSALMARETERLTIGWGIISPYTRHPVQVAMDARIVQEAAGPGPVHRRLRHLEDLPQQHEAGRAAEGDEAARAHARLGRDRARRARRRAVRVRRQGVQRRPARRPAGGARARLERAGVRRRDRAADAAARRRDRRRAADARRSRRRRSSATPARTSPPGAAKAGRDGGRRRRRLHDRRLDPRRRTATPGATAPARSPACTWRTSSRTSRAPPTRCSTWRRSGWRSSSPSPRRWRAAAASPRRRRSPTRCSTAASRSPARPADCIAAIEEYRDAGCTHIMLELWGANRHEQIRLFGEQVLPHFRG